MKKIVILITLIVNIALGGAFSLSPAQEAHLDTTLRGMMSQSEATLQAEYEALSQLLNASDAIVGGWENSKFKYSYKMLITDTQRLAIFVFHEIRNPNAKAVQMFDMQEGFILFGDANREVGVVWHGYLHDSTPPTITLNGSASLSLTRGSTYSELGATITDNIDQDVDIQIIGTVDTSTNGIYVLVYKATDNNNNESFATRVITVYTPDSTGQDTTPPMITLNGSSTLTLTRGTTYTELGANATDNIDGTLQVEILGSVDTYTNGNYVLIYKATDSSNNQALATRVVTVYTPSSPAPANQAPIVDAGANESVAVNGSVALTATASDSDGTISSYEWRSANTILSTSASFSYTPTTSGTHTISVIVTDDDGATASDSVS
ncbi:MAG: DUF5011 domain-containing protein, partial [Campylobacterota bacterium]|nr:DUF5011 domain-containing protein [Campylobacterota bacterium]